MHKFMVLFVEIEESGFTVDDIELPDDLLKEAGVIKRKRNFDFVDYEDKDSDEYKGGGMDVEEGVIFFILYFDIFLEWNEEIEMVEKQKIKRLNLKELCLEEDDIY